MHLNDLLSTVIVYVGCRPPAVALRDTLFSVSNLHLKVINQGQAAYQPNPHLTVRVNKLIIDICTYTPTVHDLG